MALPLILIIGLITLVAVVYSIVHDPDSPERTGTPQSNESGISECASIPPEATELIDDIHSGGPFDHPSNDGSHFGNYEQILPREDSDYYREYTVETPGVDHRGNAALSPAEAPRPIQTCTTTPTTTTNPSAR